MAPFCREQNRTRAATQVHHILPLITHPELAFIASNCVPICTGCHSRVEQMERAGIPTANLFENWQDFAP